MHSHERSRHRFPGAIVAAILLTLAAGSAQAVPSFARQTSLDCTVCHLSWPELTPTGRQFKLNGYTLGERQRFPLAGMVQASMTSTKFVDPDSRDAFPRNNSAALQQASIFAAGKITDNIGAFTQWTYDGIAHHSGVDNVDVRYADHVGEGDKGLIYGFTLNNNPSVQDVYNTGPAWGFPFASSGVALAPNASTAIEGLGQQVAGIGAYGMWHNLVYAEFTAYRTADRAFSALRAGTDRASAAALKGYNPYWRLALQHEWDDAKHSAMIGAYGLTVQRYPDNTDPTGPTDRFRDRGYDAQYQYITDRHRFSAQMNLIREKQDWNATPQTNSSGTLNSFKAKASYYFEKKYGISAGHFYTKGGANDSVFNVRDPDTGDTVPVVGSVNGSPDTSGYVLELNYLPMRDIRLVLQYTGYTKFNGASSFYDGANRNAKDNNTLYMLAWFMF
jgi:hypothetical protein